MGIHPNSLEAHRTNRYGKRCQAILGDIRANGPATDRQIAQRLGFSDMNKVRPRINGLIEEGVLQELSKRRCETTGKTVRVVGIPPAPPTVQPGLHPLFDAITEAHRCGKDFT